jgi:hypothetical protein
MFFQHLPYNLQLESSHLATCTLLQWKIFYNNTIIPQAAILVSQQGTKSMVVLFQFNFAFQRVILRNTLALIMENTCTPLKLLFSMENTVFKLIIEMEGSKLFLFSFSCHTPEEK